MNIKHISFDELPSLILDEIHARYKAVQPIEATVMEFETVAEPMYTISLLDLNRNVIVEIAYTGNRLMYENNLTFYTVFKAMEKYPERFGLRFKEELNK